MKKRKILYFLPVFSLLLTGCDFASIMDKAKDLGGKIVNPIKDLINPDKEGENGEGGGNQEGGGGEEQQVVAVSIKELIGVPAEIVQGETLAASSLKATVIYSDNTSKTEDVTKVELDTSKVGETTGKAYVNSLVKEFTITVEAKEAPVEIDHIEIVGSMKKTSYKVGEVFSSEGLSVKAVKKDNTESIVSGSFEFTPAKAEKGTSSVSVVAKYSDNFASEPKIFTVSVEEEQTKNYGSENAPLTVSQALALITEECTEDKAMTAQAITVQGQITEIKNSFTYESGPCFEFNISDGTSTVYVYRCHCTDQQATGVVVGATVKLVGYAKNFKGTLEFVDNGASQCHILSIEGDAPDKELVSISIEGSLTKTEYVEGQTYSSAGLSVKGHYDDGSEGVVDATITLNKTTAALGDTEIIASATFKEITAEPKTFTVTVTEKVPVIGGSVYTFKNDKTSAQNVGTWTSEEFMKHVEVDGGEIITGMKDATNAYIGGNGGSGDTQWNIWDCLKVGKSSAKGEITLLLDGTASFSKIKVSAIGARDDGTLTINEITQNVTKKAIKDDLEPIELEYEITGGITELKLSSKDAASNNYGIVITRIEFVDEGPKVPVLSSLELTKSPDKVDYHAGEEFDPTGMVITAKYTNGGEDKVLAAEEYSVDKTVLSLNDEFVTVSYEEGEIEKTVQVPVSVTKAPAPVTGISLNLSEVTIKVNEQDVTLTATVTPEDADDPSVVWSVSEEGVVTVNNGVVHAVAAGEVTVTATAGDFHADCVVTVAPADKVLSGIEVTTPPSKTSYVAGEIFDPTGMVVTASYSSGHDSEEVTGYTYSTAALEETDTTVEIDYNGKKAYVEISVSPAPVLDSITVANAQGKTAEYTVGDVISKDDIVVTAHYTQGKPDAVVTNYTISKTTALALGDTSVTITYIEGGVEKAATYAFTVEAAPVITTSKITIANDFPGSSYAANNVERFASDASGLAFETNQAQINGGEIQLQSATGKIWTTSPINNGIKKIEFTTTSTVLEVYVGNVLCPNSENGGVKLTGNDGVYEVSSETYKYLSIINGSATSKISTDISITYNGTISSYLIPVHSILLSDSSVDLAVGGTKQVTASVSPSTVSNGSVTWSVQNESVSGCVTVSQDGLITGVAEGTAEVVCTSVLTPEVKKIINVTVSADVVTADVTYAFAKAESDSSSDMGDGLLSRFTDNVQDGTNLVTAATGTKCYDGIYGLKFGSGKAAGKAVITTSAAISKIVVRAIAYGTDKTVIKINGEEIALSSEMATYEVTFGTATTSITIEAKNASNCRYYISSIAMFK